MCSRDKQELRPRRRSPTSALGRQQRSEKQQNSSLIAERWKENEGRGWIATEGRKEGVSVCVGGLGVWVCACWGRGACVRAVEYSLRPCDLHFLSAPHTAAGSVHDQGRQLRKHNTIASHPQGPLKHSCCPLATLRGLVQELWTLTYIDATDVREKKKRHAFLKKAAAVVPVLVHLRGLLATDLREGSCSQTCRRRQLEKRGKPRCVNHKIHVSNTHHTRRQSRSHARSLILNRRPE